jgi:hypothetical protein
LVGATSKVAWILCGYERFMELLLSK